MEQAILAIKVLIIGEIDKWMNELVLTHSSNWEISSIKFDVRENELTGVIRREFLNSLILIKEKIKEIKLGYVWFEVLRKEKALKNKQFSQIWFPYKKILKNIYIKLKLIKNLYIFKWFNLL